MKYSLSSSIGKYRIWYVMNRDIQQDKAKKESQKLLQRGTGELKGRREGRDMSQRDCVG